uniref:Uncharacterized protein n=1 Tax=Cucumis melo TaxID=3656 RepID=A0A9I9EDC8_CUCME
MKISYNEHTYIGWNDKIWVAHWKFSRKTNLISFIANALTHTFFDFWYFSLALDSVDKKWAKTGDVLELDHFSPPVKPPPPSVDPHTRVAYPAAAIRRSLPLPSAAVTSPPPRPAAIVHQNRAPSVKTVRRPSKFVKPSRVRASTTRVASPPDPQAMHAPSHKSCPLHTARRARSTLQAAPAPALFSVSRIPADPRAGDLSYLVQTKSGLDLGDRMFELMSRTHMSVLQDHHYYDTDVMERPDGVAHTYDCVIPKPTFSILPISTSSHKKPRSTLIFFHQLRPTDVAVDHIEVGVSIGHIEADNDLRLADSNFWFHMKELELLSSTRTSGNTYQTCLFLLFTTQKLQKKEEGKEVSEIELFQLTHSNENKGWVNEAKAKYVNMSRSYLQHGTKCAIKNLISCSDFVKKNLISFFVRPDRDKKWVETGDVLVLDQFSLPVENGLFTLCDLEWDVLYLLCDLVRDAPFSLCDLVWENAYCIVKLMKLAKYVEITQHSCNLTKECSNCLSSRKCTKMFGWLIFNLRVEIGLAAWHDELVRVMGHAKDKTYRKTLMKIPGPDEGRILGSGDEFGMCDDLSAWNLFVLINMVV